jgi:hypothetical protein
MKKILIACLNANGVGGSELYHIELVNALSKFDIDITFTTLVPKQDNDVRKKINTNVKQLDMTELDTQYDLIVASQPQVLTELIKKYPTTPKIAIIHSAIRSEDPVYHESIKHYIAVQPDIYRLLKKYVPIDKIDLFYNPIDVTRFNSSINVKRDKYTVLFVGNWDDPIRANPANHLIQNCIEQDWECWFMSVNRPPNFNHPNIKFFDQVYDTEIFLRYADATAGIGGRSTIEGWLCNKSSYIYTINAAGDILNVRLVHPPKIDRFNSDTVAKQHIQLYNKIING